MSEDDKCPHCHEAINASLLAIAKKDARTVLGMKADKDAFLTAETIGKTIINYAKLLDSVAQGMTDGKFVHFIEKIETIDGEIRVTFLMAAEREKKKKPVQGSLLK